MKFKFKKKMFVENGKQKKSFSLNRKLCGLSSLTSLLDRRKEGKSERERKKGRKNVYERGEGKIKTKRRETKKSEKKDHKQREREKRLRNRYRERENEMSECRGKERELKIVNFLGSGQFSPCPCVKLSHITN